MGKSGKEDLFRKFKDSFDNMEGHFHVLDHRVPVEVQLAYFRYSDDKAILVYINASDEAKEIPWTNYSEILNKYHTVGVDILNGGNVDNQQPFTAAPKSSTIIAFPVAK